MVNIRIKDKSRFSFLAKYIGGIIMDLTATDLLAIEKDNADHLLDKGAYYYGEGQYTEAVEYY